jgi:hypothetical protein
MMKPFTFVAAWKNSQVSINQHGVPASCVSVLFVLCDGSDILEMAVRRQESGIDLGRFSALY